MLYHQTQSSSKKTKKKQKPHSSKKKPKQERKKIPFLTLCHLYLATLLIKKNTFCCVTFTWHSSSASSHLVIPWMPSRTVSAIGGPVCFILSRRKVFLLCHLYLPQFMQKKSRDNIEKNDISRPLLPGKLFKILSAFTELANPLKKNLANTPADLKKRNRNEKK